MMTIYADREDPSWRVGWYDGDGALRDFSEGYTFRVEFLSMRNERIMYTKTGGITGASGRPAWCGWWGHAGAAAPRWAHRSSRRSMQPRGRSR